MSLISPPDPSFQTAPGAEPPDPLPFGPETWEATQWIGLAVYLTLFLIFVVLVWRLARPEVDSELAPEDEQASSPPGMARQIED